MIIQSDPFLIYRNMQCTVASSLLLFLALIIDFQLAGYVVQHPSTRIPLAVINVFESLKAPQACTCEVFFKPILHTNNLGSVGTNT
jgi:hypothetical protein